MDPNSEHSRAWLRSNADDDRRTGRSTALAHLYLAKAWDSPGEIIMPEDHTLMPAGIDVVLNYVQDIALSLGCEQFMVFHKRGFRVMPPADPWKAAKMRVDRAAMRL